MRQCPIFRFQFQNSKGFTLIELLVVISSVVIISGFGFASLVTSQRKQHIEQTAQNVKLFIEKAKFNAISRVVGSSACPSGSSLVAYRINADVSGKTFTMFRICQNSAGVITTLELSRTQVPSDVNLAASGCSSFEFRVLSSNVQCVTAGALPVYTLSGFGNTKRLTLESSGNVKIE